VVPLSVTVGQLLTSITVTPASPVSVSAGGTQAFSASGLDQFGMALATQPTFAWAIASGGAGSINASTGVYTAPSILGSTATVTPSAQGPSGTVSGSTFITTTAASQTPAALTGAQIGTSGSYQNNGASLSNAFDGNLSTFFDAPTAGTAASPNWVGLDLGSAYTISSITFAPRVGFESRMEGGIFQGSNSSSFSNPTTLYTISSTTAPQDGYTMVSSVNPGILISSLGSFRYVRYVAPAGGWGNIAELQFAGTPAGTLPTTPTTPGTPTLTVATNTTAQIAWAPSTDSAGISQYALYRNGTQVGTSTTPSYLDTGLSAGTTYSYTVVATDDRRADRHIRQLRWGQHHRQRLRWESEHVFRCPDRWHDDQP
jgi:hypothetical protein